MSRVNGTNSYWKGTTSALAIADINTDDMQVFHITTPPSLITPFAANLISVPGRFREFVCDMVIDDPGDGVVRTTFYDTSGVPTGTEPVLYSQLAFSSKTGGSTQAIQNHTIQFPGEGIIFKKGIGVICQRIASSPTIVAVDALFYYQPAE